MAETKETTENFETKEAHDVPSSDYVATDGIVPDRPTGWMYRERKIGPLVIPWYASPRFQLIMVSFVCFTCPGMFNALTGLGGNGRSDTTLGDRMVIIRLS
jgi:hypothetical protein